MLGTSMLVRLGPAWVLLILGMVHSRGPQDPPRPSETPALKAEMDVLAPLLGEWQITGLVQSGGSDPKSYATRDQVTWEAALGGAFIKVSGRSFVSDGRSVEYLWMLTYDRQARAYRAWYFDSIGPPGEYTGTWDSGTSTMAWRALNAANGWEVTMTTRIIDKDHATHVLVVKDSKGRLVGKNAGEAVRRGKSQY